MIPTSVRLRTMALLAPLVLACADEDPVAPEDSVPVATDPLPAQPIVRPQVAFVSSRDGADYIYVANQNGSMVGRLARGTDPAWSWDGRRIAYVGEGHSGIHVMNDDGSNQVRLTQGGEDPAWSPDGRIAFRQDGSERDIFVMNADGTGDAKLIDAEFPVDPDDSVEGDPPSLWAPTWFPDGQTIAFTRTSASIQLYLANADGTGLRRFTDLYQFSSAAVSPDGSALAFTFWDPFHPNPCGTQPWIAIASPTASDSSDFEAYCGTGLGYAWSPDWSHHGTQLVFSQPSRAAGSSTSSPTHQRIYLLLLADRQWRQFIPEALDPANPDYDDHSPAWARVAR